MRSITIEALRELLQKCEPPCVSLYQPTHRANPDALHDPIRYAAARIGTLLVEADRDVPGRFDPTTGEVRPGRLADPEVGDVIDDLAEAVLRTGGEVVVVPAARKPTDTGLAATFRH